MRDKMHSFPMETVIYLDIEMERSSGRIWLMVVKTLRRLRK